MYTFPTISQRGLSKPTLTAFWSNFIKYDYIAAKTNYSTELSSPKLQIDSQIKNLSATGKLFKLKSLKEVHTQKSVFWGSNPVEDYIDKLLEDYTQYGRIQTEFTSTPILHRFKIVAPVYQPYDFAYTKWTPLTIKLEGYSKKPPPKHPTTTQGFKYYG